MIQVRVTEGLEYSITYHMEGLRCTEVLTKDLTVGLEEVKQKMQLSMGLAKGKTFTSISRSRR